MKKWFIPVLLVATLGIASQAAAQTHPAQTLDEAWIKGAQAGDVEALVALYAPDAVLYTPGVFEAKGTDAIRKELASLVGGFTITNMKIDGTYETHGDLSLGWGRWSMTATPKGGGAPEQWAGRATVIAKRVKGKWLYAVDHASMPMPAPPTTKPSGQ
jgi:uncharacterized protein (TIGR02246 family)